MNKFELMQMTRKTERNQLLRTLEKRLDTIISKINHTNIDDKEMLEMYGEQFTVVQELVSYVSKF